MELGAGVAKALFTRAQSTEVCSRLCSRHQPAVPALLRLEKRTGNNFVVELEKNTALGNTTDCDIKLEVRINIVHRSGREMVGQKERLRT